MPPKPRLSARYQLVTDDAFTGAVAIAAVRIALEVMTQPTDDPNQPLRVGYATAVLGDPLAHAERLTAAALVDDALAELAGLPVNQQTGLDEAIDARLRLVWDRLAGITHEQPRLP